jgi:ferric-dicitrate binding protein FerR (iron transport regulator)
MNKEAVKAILEKALRHEATPEEYGMLMEWIRTDEHHELSSQIGDLIAQRNGHTLSTEEPYDHEYWDGLCREILSKDIYSIGLPFTGPEKPVFRMPSRRRWYWAGAACILGLIALASWLWLNDEKTAPPVVAGKTEPTATDKQPGSNKAVLVLADGSSIQLDSTGNSQITADNGVLVKRKGGKLEYLASGGPSARKDQYNVLSTPRGGQYQLVLPDGTQVWLNAASSIRYPIAFPDDLRSVEVTGEVYFEVKKDAGKPFIVKGGGQEVRVLGTSFNMNVYEDEPLRKITLIDGAVQVQALEPSSGADPGRQKVTLRPGEQAKVGRLNNKMNVVAVDTEEATSWKNGFFYTRKANIGELMRQIGRWFDVEVDLDQLPPEKVTPLPTFSGAITRDLTLTQVIKILELSDVKVKLEGKKITILP